MAQKGFMGDPDDWSIWHFLVQAHSAEEAIAITRGALRSRLMRRCQRSSDGWPDVKAPKRPRDTNEFAKRVVDIATVQLQGEAGSGEVHSTATLEVLWTWGERRPRFAG